MDQEAIAFLALGFGAAFEVVGISLAAWEVAKAWRALRRYEARPRRAYVRGTTRGRPPAPIPTSIDLTLPTSRRISDLEDQIRGLQEFVVRNRSLADEHAAEAAQSVQQQTTVYVNENLASLRSLLVPKRDSLIRAWVAVALLVSGLLLQTAANVLSLNTAAVDHGPPLSSVAE